jgi:hypothetical protein
VKVRGLFPSLGAGGSLIAAALCAFAVFGGLLAFRGESPRTAEANDGTITLPGGAARAKTVSRSPVGRAIPQRAAVATPPARPAPRRSVAVTLRRPANAAPRATSPVRTAPSPPATAPSRPTTTPPPPPPAAAPKPPGTVTRAVQQTRAAARPVTDVVPAPAQQPVDAIGDTVEQVATTVDQTVGALLQP